MPYELYRLKRNFILTSSLIIHTFSESARMSRDEAFRIARPVAPAGAFVVVATGRVEAQSADHGEGVAGPRIDRDPAAGAWLAPRLQGFRGRRLFEQAGAVEEKGNRSRAIVSGVIERRVPAAKTIRLAHDRVHRADAIFYGIGRIRGSTRDQAAQARDLARAHGRHCGEQREQ